VNQSSASRFVGRQVPSNVWAEEVYTNVDARLTVPYALEKANPGSGVN
jgi:hypothetical protein